MLVEHVLLEKLGKALTMKDEPSAECDVVYVIVLVRKLLELYDPKKANEGNALLMLYCNWVLHPKIERIQVRMRDYLAPLLKEFERRVKWHRSDAFASGDFARSSSLRNTMQKFLNDNSITTRWVSNDPAWRSFKLLLSRILAEQPLHFDPPLRFGDHEALTLKSIRFKNMTDSDSVSFEANVEFEGLAWHLSFYGAI